MIFTQICLTPLHSGKKKQPINTPIPWRNYPPRTFPEKKKPPSHFGKKNHSHYPREGRVQSDFPYKKAQFFFAFGALFLHTHPGEASGSKTSHSLLKKNQSVSPGGGQTGVKPRYGPERASIFVFSKKNTSMVLFCLFFLFLR